MPPSFDTGNVTLGPEDVTIAVPNLKPSKPVTASVAATPPAEETVTGNITLGPEDRTIAIPNPSRSLPAATMGRGLLDTGNITLGPEDRTIAIPTGKPGAATMPSQGGLPAATRGPATGTGTNKPRSHMESLTGNDGWIGDRYRDSLRRVWPLSRRPEMLDSAHRFFERWGVLSIVFCRFLPVFRSTVPLVAGMAGMCKRRFMVANVGSALIWSPAHVYPGTLAGLTVDRLNRGDTGTALLWGAGFVLLCLTLWLLHRRLSTRLR